jgi:hypothetical protein
VAVLTEDVVAFLMNALVDGDISRETCCAFVAPWVEGGLPSTPLAEDGAQLIHGFDIGLTDDGLAFHNSEHGWEISYEIGREDMVNRCSTWLAMYRESLE